VLRGMETETLRRLCWRAPRTVMCVMPGAVRVVFEGAVGVVPIDGVWRSAAKLLGYGIFSFCCL